MQGLNLKHITKVSPPPTQPAWPKSAQPQWIKPSGPHSELSTPVLLQSIGREKKNSMLSTSPTARKGQPCPVWLDLPLQYFWCYLWSLTPLCPYSHHVINKTHTHAHTHTHTHTQARTHYDFCIALRHAGAVISNNQRAHSLLINEIVHYDIDDEGCANILMFNLWGLNDSLACAGERVPRLEGR